MPKPKLRANKQTVFEAIDDLVADLLIRDRENDDNLPEGEIEKMIAKDVLSVDDMVEKFRESLESHLEDLEGEAKRDEDDEDDDSDLDLDDEEEDDE